MLCEREGDAHSVFRHTHLSAWWLWFILRSWSALGQGQNKRKTDIISSWKEAIDHGSAWGYGHYFPNVVSQIITISIIQTFVKNITFLKVKLEKKIRGTITLYSIHSQLQQYTFGIIISSDCRSKIIILILLFSLYL